MKHYSNTPVIIIYNTAIRIMYGEYLHASLSDARTTEKKIPIPRANPTKNIIRINGSIIRQPPKQVVHSTGKIQTR